jgi:F-type H+-transporting ATPase subunit b
MTRLLALLLGVSVASPALAASKPFFSLQNTDFVVLLGFLAFIALMMYYKVPGIVGGLLDKRAEGIKNELDEARALREEAQALVDKYEREQKEVQAKAERIIAHAKQEAAEAAQKAKDDLEVSIARRMKAADEQIASAEAAAIKEVRDQAISIAIAASREVIARQLSAADASKLIDDAIGEVEAKLH